MDFISSGVASFGFPLRFGSDDIILLNASMKSSFYRVNVGNLLLSFFITAASPISARNSAGMSSLCFESILRVTCSSNVGIPHICSGMDQI